jgi:hypothetical protein
MCRLLGKLQRVIDLCRVLEVTQTHIHIHAHTFTPVSCVCWVRRLRPDEFPVGRSGSP